MRFHVNLSTDENGEFVAECDLLGAQSRGLSETVALNSVKREIRNRLELCSCSGVDDDLIEIDVIGGGHGR